MRVAHVISVVDFRRIIIRVTYQSKHPQGKNSKGERKRHVGNIVERPSDCRNRFPVSHGVVLAEDQQEGEDDESDCVQEPGVFQTHVL